MRRRGDRRVHETGSRGGREEAAKREVVERKSERASERASKRERGRERDARAERERKREGGEREIGRGEEEEEKPKEGRGRRRERKAPHSHRECSQSTVYPAWTVSTPSAYSYRQTSTAATWTITINNSSCRSSNAEICNVRLTSNISSSSKNRSTRTSYRSIA